MEALAGLIGILAPAALALFKRLGLKKVQQDMVVLAVLIVVSAMMMFASGELNPLACSELGILECLGVVEKYLGLVIGFALISYKMFWEASGLDNRIAGK